MNITRPTVLEISISAFKSNINKIQEFLRPSTKIMPVFKANAYGTYLNTNLEILNLFDIVAVATVDEGKLIRDLGYEKEIFVLNQPYEDEITKIIESRLVVGICCENFSKKLAQYDYEFKVHIEVETGMGRTGILPENILNYINNLSKNIVVEGIYTHLSSADNNDEYTRKQFGLFDEAVKEISKYKNLKYIHVNASNGILNYSKVGDFNLVRPGIIMYGYPSDIDTCKNIKLEPVAVFKSKITFLKNVPEGTSIGYSRSFITKKDSKIATIPVGYADGLRRNLSNKGEVIINGIKVPIIGRVCMDSFMVDVTEIENVEVGDSVYIWDNKIITLEDVAKKCDTINYEILSTISNRVPRIFVD